MTSTAATRTAAALDIAAIGVPVIPCCWPDGEGNCGCGRDHEERDIGKAPLTKAGVLDASTDPAQIRKWFTKWPDANIGIALAPAELVDIAPDSPVWHAEFIARGIPNSAPSYRSGGGDGHVHYLVHRPEACPALRVCRSGEYDLLASGYAIAPPSRHRSGARYEWITPLLELGFVPEAPEWTVEELQWADRRSGPRPDREGDDGEPPVRLHGEALRRWNGELVEHTPDGGTDRSESLWWIGLVLKRAGAARRTIIEALAERDVALGFNKYSERRDGGRTEYENIADKLDDEGSIVFGDRENAGVAVEVPGWRVVNAPKTAAHGLHKVGAGGEHRRELAVAPEPVLIVKTGHAISGIDVRVTEFSGASRLAFIDEAVIRSKTPADALHACAGLVMTPDHARVLQRYFGAVVQHLDGALPVVQAMRRAGWDGDDLLLPGVRRMVPPNSWLESYHHAVVCESAREAWAEILTQAVRWPKLALVMGAAVGSLYTGRLRAGSSNVHLVGDSRRGKTRGMQIAASVFGDPDRILITWNTTANGLTANLEQAAILPVFIDETGAANMRRETFEAIIFGAASGRGRGRANRDGSARTVASWNSVVISSGERGLVSSSALTGARARVLEVEAPLTDDAESIDYLHDLARQHHGWPARWLVEQPRPDVAEVLFTDLRGQLHDAIGGTSIDRTLLTNAALYATGFVSLCVAVDVAGPLGQLVDGVVTVLRESIGSMRADGATASERLTEAIAEDTIVHSRQYTGEDRERAGWWINEHTLALLPSAAKRIARAIGLEDPTPAFRALRDIGVLVPGDGQNLAKKLRMPGTVWDAEAKTFRAVAGTPVRAYELRIHGGTK